MDGLTTSLPHKGRGALTNSSGRFERATVAAVDDGWDRDDGDLPPLRTQVTIETPRTIIARNTSPDIPFDRSLNPYKGCEHGCVYCYARPGHAYMGLSPGLDFESRLFAKPDAPALLERELSKPGYRPRTLQLGSNTDPYQPIEKSHRITRRVLKVLAAFRHPVSITTKSALICRDLDILGPMAARGLVSAAISLTTLDRRLARALEPHHLPHYATNLANTFHTFYENCRVVSSNPEDDAITAARLKLVEAALIVFRRTLNLMGMAVPDRM